MRFSGSHRLDGSLYCRRQLVCNATRCIKTGKQRLLYGWEMAMKRNIVSVFKPHGNGLAKLFGSLEADIMALIWEQQEASARDIFEALRDIGQRISYGATKTVLDRLVAKQVLARTMDNNQYTYTAL